MLCYYYCFESAAGQHSRAPRTKLPCAPRHYRRIYGRCGYHWYVSLRLGVRDVTLILSIYRIVLVGAIHHLFIYREPYSVEVLLKCHLHHSRSSFFWVSLIRCTTRARAAHTGEDCILGTPAGKRGETASRGWQRGRSWYPLLWHAAHAFRACKF